MLPLKASSLNGSHMQDSDSTFWPILTSLLRDIQDPQTTLYFHSALSELACFSILSEWNQSGCKSADCYGCDFLVPWMPPCLDI